MRGCLVMLLVGAGCASKPPPTVTYQGFVRGFLETRCVACHQPSGEAPFSLVTWADVQPHRDHLVEMVEDGHMPPHAPRADCRRLAMPGVVPPDELAKLQQWRADAYPEGDAAQYTGKLVIEGMPTPPAAEPTLVFKQAEAYAPPLGPDVFVDVTLEGTVPRDTWVVATEIVPAAAQVVHHANAFVITDTSNTLPGPTQILGGWAPGYSALVMPENSALFVPAGATLQLSVHYSTATIGEGALPPPGRSELRLWTLPEGQAPARQAFFDSLADTEFVIPALASRYESTTVTPLNYAGADIIGVLPHMHLLGVAFQAALLHADGGVECLADMPHYSFLHQPLIRFAPDDFVHVNDGDAHRMTCVWDNSQANQPLVDGEPKQSVETRWGGTSIDEMCVDALLRVVDL